MNKLIELANGEKVARFVAQCCLCVSECREIKESEQIFQFSDPLLAPPEVYLLQLSQNYVITNSTCVKGASQICTAKKIVPHNCPYATKMQIYSAHYAQSIFYLFTSLFFFLPFYLKFQY